MRRYLYKKLLEWKGSSLRKPLLLQGARQVGKTFLVKEFGGKEYDDFVYLNFEQDPNLHPFFKGKLDPENLVLELSLYLGKRIVPHSCLIFFDEIQALPEAVTSLKYFQELAVDYHIVAAGSLLGVSLGRESSFPVGKVNFLTLYPLNFQEYLTAAGEELLVEHLEGLTPGRRLSDAIHNRLMDHLKLYYFIGGMPEAVAHYLHHKDVRAVRKIQVEILSAYRRDFSKYANKTQALKNAEVWDSIPAQLAKEKKKFKYSDVRKNARASMYDQSIEWLSSAGLLHQSLNVNAPKIPLSGYADTSKFKAYMHDVGLLGALLNVASKQFILPNGVFREYNGAFVENFVAQELVAEGQEKLFYWTSKSDAEIDFILDSDDQVFPVEVKSGLNRHKKSLHSYEEKYAPGAVFRLSPRNFDHSGSFYNLPLYATFLLKKWLPLLAAQPPDKMDLA